MSRLWPDGFQFTLAPDSIAVARVPQRFGFGTRLPVAAGHEVEVPPPTSGDQAQPWAAPLAALAKVIGDLGATGGRRAAATVILSNHFVRYALVPWSDLIESDEEGISLCRNHLRETYGLVADRWELRISGDEAESQRLVSAVESELLDELRGLFADAGMRLASIQPRLMTLCNRYRKRLTVGASWLALVEPGSLCLALLRGPGIAGLRQIRLGDAWAFELVTALERERLLVESAAAIRRVFVAATGVVDADFSAGLPWAIDWLEAPASGSQPPNLAARG